MQAGNINILVVQCITHHWSEYNQTKVADAVDEQYAALHNTHHDMSAQSVQLVSRHACVNLLGTMYLCDPLFTYVWPCRELHCCILIDCLRHVYMDSTGCLGHGWMCMHWLLASSVPACLPALTYRLVRGNCHHLLKTINSIRHYYYRLPEGDYKEALVIAPIARVYAATFP